MTLLSHFAPCSPYLCTPPLALTYFSWDHRNARSRKRKTRGCITIPNNRIYNTYYFSSVSDNLGFGFRIDFVLPPTSGSRVSPPLRLVLFFLFVLLERAPMSRCTTALKCPFYCLTHAPTVCACARGMYVRNLPSIPSTPPSPLFFRPPSPLPPTSLPHLAYHRIASHRIAHHSSFSRLQFIKIYNDLLPGFSLSLTPSTWQWQMAGPTHPRPFDATRRSGFFWFLTYVYSMYV